MYVHEPPVASTSGAWKTQRHYQLSKSQILLCTSQPLELAVSDGAREFSHQRQSMTGVPHNSHLPASMQSMTATFMYTMVISSVISVRSVVSFKSSLINFHQRLETTF